MAIGSVLGNIGKNIGNFFKNNASSIGSAGSGLFSSLFSNATTGKQQRRAYEYARQLQQQQYDLSLRGFKEAPSAQREGLTSAGYNPMLALGNIGSGVSVAGGTPVNSNATDVSGIRESISTAVQLSNQTKQTEADADAAYANADKAKAEKAAIVQRLPYIGKQAKADYMKTTMESAELENRIHYQNEYLNYLENSLKLQERLGIMGFSNAREVAGINASALRYSADRSYNASTYATDTNAETMRGIRTDRLPFGFGSTYYDKRYKDFNNNDSKYWRDYYY